MAESGVWDVVMGVRFPLAPFFFLVLDTKGDVSGYG